VKRAPHHESAARTAMGELAVLGAVRCRIPRHRPDHRLESSQPSALQHVGRRGDHQVVGSAPTGVVHQASGRCEWKVVPAITSSKRHTTVSTTSTLPPASRRPPGSRWAQQFAAEGGDDRAPDAVTCRPGHQGAPPHETPRYSSSEVVPRGNVMWSGMAVLASRPLAR